MVQAVLEVVTRWMKPSSQKRTHVIVVESANPEHHFVLGPMLARVLQKPYFDLRQNVTEKMEREIAAQDFCIVSKTSLGSRRPDACVILVDDLIEKLNESGQRTLSPLMFQCLRVAMLKLAEHRRRRLKSSD